MDLIENLKKRGRIEEADFYELMVPLDLNFIHGFSKKKIMEMTVEEITAWYNTSPRPIKYEGWTYWRGKAAA